MHIGIAVDIDDVLSDTTPFWMDIVNKKFGNSEGLSSIELLRKYKLTHNVPGWPDGPAEDFLEIMRLDSTFYKDIPVVKNSVKYVNKINKLIRIESYLTARPQEILKDTEKWLKIRGFPEKKVVARPKEVSIKEGNKWKAKILVSLHPDIIGIIDDNSGLIDFLPNDYKGTVFLYGHKEYDSSKIKVIPCENWKDLFFEIKKFVKNHETVS